MRTTVLLALLAVGCNGTPPASTTRPAAPSADTQADAELSEAETYESAGNRTEALVRYIRVSKSPASAAMRARAYQGSARIRLIQEDYSGAEMDMAHVTAIAPNDGQAWLALASVQLAHRNHMLLPMAKLAKPGESLRSLAPEGYYDEVEKSLKRAVAANPALADKAEAVRRSIPR